VADAGLAAVAAADELAYGSLDVAEGYLGLAERGSASVPDGRREQVQLLLGIVRLLLARQRGDLSAVAEEAQQLQSTAKALDAAPPAVGEDLRALALINLGVTEHWTARFAEAMQHLNYLRALAHRIGRSYLEFTGLAYQAAGEVFRSFAAAAELSSQAVELAEQHGWTDKPAAGIAFMALGTVLAYQGRPEQAEPWVQGAERTLRAEAQPAAELAICYVRGVLELEHGRNAEALAAFRAADRLAGLLAVPNPLVTGMRAFLVLTLVRLGETERAEQAFAGLGEHERERGEIRIATAMLRLAQDDPHAAMAALAPVLDGSAPLFWPPWLAQAFLLEAIARDALGDLGAADRALERALDLAEPDGVLLWFLLHPAPDLLEHHTRHRTSHASLIGQIQSLLAGDNLASGPGQPRSPVEPLSNSEIRVLRYLPTNLSGPEIASELYISPNTVRTHLRHLYAKLGTHSRADTVARARTLGLLAPSPHRGQATRPG
jgi:LuxR family maltose regulon positive regulatory protein